MLPFVLGQQQHYFDSRLTYHASRSAMGVGMGAAGYPLSNTWGYQTSYPASAYLGYNSASAYGSSLSGYTSSVLDPGALLSTPTGAGTGAITSDSASPAGRVKFHFSIFIKFHQIKFHFHKII